MRNRVAEGERPQRPRGVDQGGLESERAGAVPQVVAVLDERARRSREAPVAHIGLEYGQGQTIELLGGSLE